VLADGEGLAHAQMDKRIKSATITMHVEALPAPVALLVLAIGSMERGPEGQSFVLKLLLSYRQRHRQRHRQRR